METYQTPLFILLLLVITPVFYSLESGFYADNGLAQTIAVHKIRTREQKEMQQEILTLLGLQHRPKTLSTHGTETASAPKFMLNLYNTLNEEDGMVNEEKTRHIKKIIDRDLKINTTVGSIGTINNADMIMSFINHADKHRILRHEKDRRFFFDFSEVPLDETIQGAELRVYKKVVEDKPENYTYTIQVFSIKQGLDLEDKYLELETNETVRAADTGWVTFNVTSPAMSWQVFPTTNLGLFMSVVDEDGKDIHPGKAGIIGKHGREDKQAFLVSFFKTSTDLHVRRTRAARKRQREPPDTIDYSSDDPASSWPMSGITDERYNRKACQIRTLYVSFRDLGWQDWIIAPDGFAAFYCHGECSFPLNAQMNATNHAIVQTLVHLMDPERIPKPCCAPTKLSAISVLYFDERENVILRKYRNMVVRACGCH